MITLLIKWLILALGVFFVGNFLPGIHVPDYKVALIVALVLAVLNVTLRPILKLISLPITLITLGLFALIVNGFVFWLVPFIVKGFVIDTFWWAVLGVIVVSLITSILDRIVLGSDGKLGSSEEK
jgi:putative membrane protein